MIYLKLHHAVPIEWRVYRPQRTDKATKGAFDNYHCSKQRSQHDNSQAKEPANLTAHMILSYCSGNTRLKRSRRTQLAEPKFISNDRNYPYQQNKHSVPNPTNVVVKLELGSFYAVKLVLQETEWTEPTTAQSPDQNTSDAEYTQNIEWRRPEGAGVLQRSNRASKCCSRTGMAVQSSARNSFQPGI